MAWHQIPVHTAATSMTKQSALFHLVMKHLKTLNAFISKSLLVMKPRKEFIALRQKAVAKEGKKEGG